MSSGHDTPVSPSRNTTTEVGPQRMPDIDMADVGIHTPVVDTEMGDTSDSPATWTERKKLSELTREMRDVILRQDASLYSDVIELVGCEVPCAHINELRGNDIPTNLPPFVREAKRRECILGLQQPDSTVDAFDLAPDDPLQEFPSPIFVGASIKPQEIGSQKRNNDGQAKEKGKSGAKKKGGQKKGGPSTFAQPASSSSAKDCVKVAFHLDSQTPHIEITTRKLGEAAGKSDLLVLRLYAADFELDETKFVYIRALPATDERVPTYDEDLTSNTAGNASVSEINDMSEAGKLFQLTLALKPTLRNWSGLTAAELTTIRGRTRKESIEDSTCSFPLPSVWRRGPQELAGCRVISPVSVHSVQSDR
jgi:hypothetical protein